MPSFEQNANRKWSVRFRYVEFGKLKQKRLSGFNTKKDADKAYAEFISLNKEYKKTDYSNITFKELYNDYIKHNQHNIKVSTLYDLQQNFDRHILPTFSEMKIFKITKYDIIKWQDNLNLSSYKYSFKSKLRTYLNAIFKHAVYYFELPINPVLQVEPFKKIEPKEEMKVWSLEEFKTFISTFNNETDITYKTLFSFLYLTGCRKGEALALSWKDIDFNNKTVFINKNLTRKIKDKPYEIVTTKTGENRKLSLSDNLIELLNQLHQSTNDRFVFGGDYPLAENTVTRVFYKHIKESEVPKIHIHCLRHSHASLLISNGESIVMVAKRLGHSSIEQTLNTYSHLMPSEEKQMISKLNIAI